MMKQLAFTVGLVLAAQAVQAEEAGKIIFVAGSAQVAGQPAALGTMVQEGQLLSTGNDGYLYVKTVDNGLFILRPKTQARIATYHVDKANPANTMVKLELISGVARSQSGEAVKLARQNFRFNTPVAAIGVRGTDFTVFTDQNTSRVAVISGRVTVSGFDGACRPEGAGPCEGQTARELAAAQKGVLLQIQRGQAAPQLMQGNSLLAPDVVAPPRGDEPVGKNGTGGTAGEPNLDAKKNVSLQEKAAQQPAVKNEPNAGGNVPPLVVRPDPDPVPVVPVVPPPPVREVSWGRWNTVLNMPANSGLSKDGAERIALGDDFVLFRSRSGSQFIAPERGSIGMVIASSEAYVRDIYTGPQAATLENGQLLFNFDKRSFTTSFDLVTGDETRKMASEGGVNSTGDFFGQNRYSPNSNMTVTGAMTDLNGATYLFKSSLDAKRSAGGVVVWKK
ncbi:FecR family protein [Pseudoduganella violacea]|uniref:FecR protein domain-containing protein n=1 Tax=Pseudoduganella violacea TaxID=1715466 RepID=A0A7W5FTC9_9BURK|nr:FecR family protein [Pseudoduganella violacea]MBB3118058.1 hypothetical protein [Pseudoduganella violacea]